MGSEKPLVGRGAELARLSAAVERARAGSPAAVLLSGDAGVGKTRLLDRAVPSGPPARRDRARRALRRPRRGRPALPAVRRGAAAAGRPAPARTGRWPRRCGTGPALDRLITRPGRPAAAPAADDDAARLQLFDAVAGVLGDAAEIARAAAAGDRGPALGRPVHPRPARVPAGPAAVRAAGRGRAPTAPTTCTAATRCGRCWASCSGCRASSGWSWPRSPPAELRRLPARRCPAGRCPTGWSATCSPAPRATPTSPRSCSRPAWPADSGAADRAGRRAAGPAGAAVPAACSGWSGSPSVAGRRVSHSLLQAATGHARGRAGGGAARGRHPPRARRRRRRSYAFRHALLQEAVYGDLLPGERVRLHGDLRAAASPTGWRAARPSWPTTAWRATTCRGALSASVQARGRGDGAARAGRGAAPAERALQLWDAVPDAERRAGSDLVSLQLRRGAGARPAPAS